MLWPKGRVGSWLAVAALGIAAQAILWSVSEPSDLFSDFYKAYFPAGDRLLNEGAVATWETTNPRPSASSISRSWRGCSSRSPSWASLPPAGLSSRSALPPSP